MNVAKPFKKPEDERKNEYGFESRKIDTKVDDKTTTRNRFVADTESMTNRASRQSSAPHTNLQSSRVSHVTSSRMKLQRQESQQDLNYEARIQPYKDQILKLIRENQSLKLKQKQTEIRTTELQMKSQHQSHSPSPINMVTLIGKYQLPIRKAFQLYGYSREESNIDECRSESDIIAFLIKFISNRCQQISLKEEQARQKLSKQQRQMSKIRDSLRMLMQTNELFKSRQNKYKEKAEETKRQLNLTYEKLKKSQLRIDELESEKMTLEKCISQCQEEILKIQKQKKQIIDRNERRLAELESKIIEQSGELSKYHIKCEHYSREIEDCHESIEEWKLRCRVKDGQLERAINEMHRWKERYENNGRTDMMKYDSKTDLTKYDTKTEMIKHQSIQKPQQTLKSDQYLKIPPEIKRNLFQTAPIKSLDPIHERSEIESSTHQNYSEPRSYHQQVNNSKEQKHSDTQTFNELQNVINALQKEFDRKIKK